MNKLYQLFSPYFSHKNLSMAVLGFSSGLPLLLVGSTLTFWLDKSGISLTMIGISAIWGIPYSTKFLIAPFLHQFRLPGASRIGIRKSWILLFQLIILLAFLGLIFVDPAHNLFWVGILITFLAVSSASQDIVVDAYRIDCIAKEEQAYATSNYMSAYRLALLFMGAGVIGLSKFYTWPEIFGMIAMLQCIVLFTTLFFIKAPEDHVEYLINDKNIHVLQELKENILIALHKFLTRDKALFILLFIMLYKLPDSFVGRMMMPFYNAVGYSEEQIALISKIFGAFATVAGMLTVGFFVKRFGLYRCLFVSSIAVGLTNLAYILVILSPTSSMLMFALSIENFVGGASGAFFVMLLSLLCDKQFSILQYALFSSLANVGMSVFSIGSGFVAGYLGWTGFFVLSAAFFIPSFLMLIFLKGSILSLDESRKIQ